MQSFQYYSHMWVNQTSPSPLQSQIYPPQFTSLGIVGNLWGGNVVFQTYFSYGLCEYPFYGHSWFLIYHIYISFTLAFTWIENTDFSYCPKIRSSLTPDQIRYFNTLFILGINVLPFTPFTQALIDRYGKNLNFRTIYYYC